MWALTDATMFTTFAGPQGVASSATLLHRIPSQNGSPLADDGVFSANYCGSARIDLGSTDWGAPTTPKVFRSVEIWADNLQSGYRYCDIYYTIDASTSTAYLGRAQDSPRTTLYFPSSTNYFATGQAIDLSLRSGIVGTNYALTPIYRSIVLRGQLRPRAVETITAVVRITDNLPDRRGTPMRTGPVMLAELRTLAEQTKAAYLVDLAGATNWVSVLSPIDENENYQQGEVNPEVAATIRMAVLTFTGQ